MLQLFVVLYAPGLLLGIPMRNRMLAALIAFVINYAAYFSEIYRGGIESIPVGQHEACAVLGMTRSQAFFKVVLLQVVKRITPSMGNEVITLVKDTALARVIGVAEIIMVAERYTKQGLIWPLFSTGLFFLLFNGLLTILLARIEGKMDYFRC
jgi:polar amino acid transport system permease protein